MVARRTLAFAVLSLAVAFFAGCATDNPLTASGIDATAPAAPSNLVASTRGGELLLSWDASTDADVAGYDVYRYSPDPARENSYVKINSTLITDNEYLVTDASGTSAWYRIKAVDSSSNTSASSGALSAAVPAEGSSDGGSIAEPGVERSSRP